MITPDQKILKKPSDLKLYIAKSGAIVDSNIVNFSMPKRTAKMVYNSKKKAKQEMEIDDESHVISVSGSNPSTSLETS